MAIVLGKNVCEFLRIHIASASLLAKHIDPQHPSAVDFSKLKEAG